MPGAATIETVEFDESLEEVAKAIHWAAFELYPPDSENPVARMTKDQCWAKTGYEQRRLARFQALRAREALGGVNPSR